MRKPQAPALPPRPEPPAPGDCCGSGCARCVIDVYQEQLQAWEREVARIQQRLAADKAGRARRR